MADPKSTIRRKPRFRERHALAVPEAPPRTSPKPPPPPPVSRLPSRPQLRVVSRTLPQLTVEKGLYAGILLLGFALRIWDVGAKAMHGDEAEHAWFAWHLFNGTGYQYDPVYHGPLQFIVTAFFYFLFGVSDTTARL